MDVPDENQDARRLAAVLERLVEGHRAAALERLRPLIGVTCRTHPIVPMPVLPREHRSAGIGAKTRSPPVVVIASVYARDGFICRYWGRWTIPNQALRLISTAFPDDFPWHTNWRMDVTPHAYWNGCVHRYRELWEALGRPDAQVHAPWIKAYGAAVD